MSYFKLLPNIRQLFIKIYLFQLRKILGFMVALLLVVAIVLVVLHNDDCLFSTSRVRQKLNYQAYFQSQSVLGVYEKAAVATDSPYCAPFGREILEKNGSAIDAAIAVLLCMCVVIPESMGLGGGPLITYYDAATRSAKVIDGREVAPLRATPDMFNGNASLARKGPLSIAVPGELKAYWMAHQMFGRLPWSKLFEGAIKISETGYEVHEHMDTVLKVRADQLRQHEYGRTLRNVFTNPKTNQFYKLGEHFKFPLFTQTLKRLANSSIDLLYSGEMGAQIIKELKELGAIITLDDLKSYRVRVYDAFETNLGDIKYYGTKLPGSGMMFAFMLKVMYKFKELYPNSKTSEEQSTLFYHRLVEVFKHTYAKRALLGDPMFDDVSEVVSNLTSDSFVDYIASKIVDNETFPIFYYGDVFTKNDRGTSHVSVIDRFGNAAAISSTINGYFGSFIMSPSTGILLNNEMDDFSSSGITNEYGVPPTEFNHVAPGKRPISSMCPSIFVNSKNGRPVLVIGGSGGTQITTGNTLVALRHFLFRETIKSAIDSPRLHHQLMPDHILFESNFPQNILKRLEAIGHKIKVIEDRGSVIEAIGRDETGKITANSDFRKGGSISGY